MSGVRRALADGWAPSVSVLLHAAVLMAALFLVSHPTPPVSGEKPIPVSLVTLPASSPPPPRPEPVVAPEPSLPPVTSTAESAPVAPPIKKPAKKALPRPRHEPTVQAESTVEQSVPSIVAAEPSDAPVRSAEPAGPPPSYLSSLRQKLERNKIYPRAARQRRQEGTAILRFVVDREGHVLSRHVEKSTGYGELDREVEAMLERAQPLPPMPAEMTQAQLELVVPIDFHLR
jgi:protein TonB